MLATATSNSSRKIRPVTRSAPVALHRWVRAVHLPRPAGARVVEPLADNLDVNALSANVESLGVVGSGGSSRQRHTLARSDRSSRGRRRGPRSARVSAVGAVEEGTDTCEHSMASAVGGPAAL